MGWIIDKISDIADDVADGILMGLVGAVSVPLCLAADAIMALDEIIITIKGIITREKLKEKMKEHGIEKIMIDRVNICDNVVSYHDIETGKPYKVEGDGISSEITVGIHI